MSDSPSSARGRRPRRSLSVLTVLYGVIALLALAAAFVGTELYVRSLGPRAKIRVTKALADRFNADVTLGQPVERGGD